MANRNYKIIILANEKKDDHIGWIKACEVYKKKLDYRVVYLTRNDWYEQIKKEGCDMLLAKPGGISLIMKELYDERIHHLIFNLKYKVFPSYLEIKIYENKRFLSEWLKVNHIPHPQTFIFYNKNESTKFLEQIKYPLVSKLNIGASGRGVRIFDSKKKAQEYNSLAFKKGLKASYGPNFSKGKLLSRFINKIMTPKSLIERFQAYSAVASNIQKGFVIFQEYIKHDHEWRVVRIGESFFAHKKLKKGDKASGSLLKWYENPPLKLLDFVKEITDKFGFYSQAVDIFEVAESEYLINEMQCIFGQSDPYQMLIDGKPGRYIKVNDSWVFEEGDFAKNACYNLRVEYVIEQLNKERKH